MPYVSRDREGNIESLYAEASAIASEYVSAHHPAVLAFIEGCSGDQAVKLTLQDSDADIARITEDLVHLLVQKNVILFTDLPDVVQTKLMARGKLRSQLDSSGPSLLSEDETI